MCLEFRRVLFRSGELHDRSHVLVDIGPDGDYLCTVEGPLELGDLNLTELTGGSDAASPQDLEAESDGDLGRSDSPAEVEAFRESMHDK